MGPKLDLNSPVELSWSQKVRMVTAWLIALLTESPLQWPTHTRCRRWVSISFIKMTCVSHTWPPWIKDLGVNRGWLRQGWRYSSWNGTHHYCGHERRITTLGLEERTSQNPGEMEEWSSLMTFVFYVLPWTLEEKHFCCSFTKLMDAS